MSIIFYSVVLTNYYHKLNSLYYIFGNYLYKNMNKLNIPIKKLIKLKVTINSLREHK